MGASSRKPSLRKLPPPKYFSESKVEPYDGPQAAKLTPFFEGNPRECTHKPDGGWLSFYWPKHLLRVSLRLPGGGDPHLALQEWMVRYIAERTSGEMLFDVHRIVEAWNCGIDPNLEVDHDGEVRLGGSRAIPWDYMAESIEIWAQSRRDSFYPPDLAAVLDPDWRVPFMTEPLSNSVPSRNRWINVSVDLMGNIEDQLRTLRKRLSRLRAYTLMACGRQRERPGAREIGRDVLIFTLS